MAQYMLLYKGPATPPEKMDPAQIEEIMGAWMKWMSNCGSALVDPGQMMTPNRKSIVDNGSAGTPADMNGYSILECGSIEEAIKYCDDHPFLVDKTGEFSVDVYELQKPSMS